mmetsp:Transcript_32876/g.57433  ORF Transcript_32876/g.57433 Transcript_32876/m.57433 type:complete len:1026 (-) Transcript_32876:3693-6770(-)
MNLQWGLNHAANMENVAGDLSYPATVEKVVSQALSLSDLSLMRQMSKLLKCEVRVISIDKLKVEQVASCCDTVGLIVSLLQDGDSWCLLQHTKESEIEKGRRIDSRGFPFRCVPEMKEFDVLVWDVPTSMLRIPLIMQSPGSLSTGQLLSSHLQSVTQSHNPSVLPSIRNSTLQSSFRGQKRSLEHLLVNDLKVLDQARTTDNSLANVRMKTSRALDGIAELESLSDLHVALESVSKQFVESNWFVGDYKLKALDNLYYLERLMKNVASKLAKTITTLKTDNSGLKSKSTTLESTSMKLQSLESKLTGCEIELKKYRLKDTEMREYYEAQLRKEKLRQVQLEVEVDNLKSNLKEIAKAGDREHLVEQLNDIRLKYRQTVSEYTAALEQRETKISQLMQEKGIIKQELQSLNSFKENFESIMRENQEKLEKQQTEKEKLREQIWEATERLEMYLEETRNDRASLKQARVEYNKLDIQLSEAKNKLSQIELNIMVGNLTLNSENVAVVSLDDPLFAMVREAPVSAANNLLLGLPKDNIDHTSHAENIADVSEVDLGIYRFNRPTFAGLMHIPNTSQIALQLPFSNWLELTIRGIFDSKYYEHLMCYDETGRIPSRFPEFVYGWFSTFEIDEKTHQVIASELWWRRDAAERSRLNLLLALKNDKVRKIWEVVSFLEFLNEDCMLDELGFYLHCRNMLFQGPQLALSTGRFSALHYVSYLRVCEVVDRVMYKISTKERSELKGLLLTKTRNRKNKLTVEASLALRVMLEYYRREKKCRVIVVKELFDKAPKTDGGIDFDAFRDICTNINHDMSEAAMAKFYRECWILGNGRMDATVFLLMANETPFFFKALRLKGEWDAPPLDEKTEIDGTAGEYAQRMADAYSDYKKMSKNYINLLKEAFSSMGCSDLMHHLKLLEDSIKRKCRGNPEDFNGRNLTDIYKAFWRIFIELKLAYQQANYSHIEYEDDYRDLRKSCSAFLDRLLHIHMQKISTNRAIRLIQKNWRDRSRKSINVLTTVIKGAHMFKKPLK